MVSSTSLSCSSLDELEALLSYVKTPAAELPEPAAIAFVTSTNPIKIYIYGTTIMALLKGCLGTNRLINLVHFCLQSFGTQIIMEW